MASVEGKDVQQSLTFRTASSGQRLSRRVNSGGFVGCGHHGKVIAL